jgi:NADH-quinone oxidoreductase subunit J
MQAFDILFFVFALITIVSACIVVFSKNLMYAAFSLLFTFFGVAALYVLLYADFLAVTQVLIYVGGILVLLLFGVMLTSKVVKVEIQTGTLHVVPAMILRALLLHMEECSRGHRRRADHDNRRAGGDADDNVSAPI